MGESSKYDVLIISLKRSFSLQCEDEEKDAKWNLLRELLSYLSDGAKEIQSNYYTILSFLLDALRPNLFRNKKEEQLFDDVFLKGPLHISFSVLVRHLSSSSQSYERDKILNLLKTFLQGTNMQSMLLHLSTKSESWSGNCISSTKLWDDLITLIVSLPERVANKTKGNTEKIFKVSFYIPLITSSILKTLHKIHECITKEKDCSLEFLGRLIGRLCNVGHANVVVKKLASDLIAVSETDFIWRRIGQSLVTKIPSTLLEAFITHLLLFLPWYGYVDWILGDAVLTSNALKYLITVKLLLIRFFEKEASYGFLRNVIGYLASSDSRKSLFDKVLNDVLDVWSDGSALKHQSFQQQYYIASVLMVCAGWIKHSSDNYSMKDNLQKVLHGVQIRIGNSEQLVRDLGMIVGESLTSAIDSSAPKLDFKFEETDMHRNLKDLISIPAKPTTSFSLCEAELKCFEDVERESVEWKKPQSEMPSVKEDEISDELDSDDDLEPYDMSNDVPLSDSKRPMYIRDCMLGLIEKEKPDWTEACLKHAENLIRSNPDTIQEIAVEMTKILLHLEDSFSTTDFIGLRHRSLISLVVMSPVKVAKYLTSQFYERDYNIRQRLDILEVLAASSQELSQVNIRVTKLEPEYVKSRFVNSAEQQWKSIVNERIELKTRRFKTGPTKPPRIPQENKFTLVAGFFFFPLLEKYDINSKMLNLIEDDSYVLGRLLYTLGIIMYSAINIPLAKQMGSSFLKFLSVVRDHSDVFVRQAVIFALSTIFISVPAFFLMSELQDDVYENQQWLQNVLERDSEIECQIKASRALNLLINIMKQEMPSLE